MLVKGVTVENIQHIGMILEQKWRAYLSTFAIKLYMDSQRILVCHSGVKFRVDIHWNGNIVILTKFTALAVPKVVKITTSGAASDENDEISVSVFWAVADIVFQILIVFTSSPRCPLSQNGVSSVKPKNIRTGIYITSLGPSDAYKRQ